MSAYEIYYGKQTIATSSYILDIDLLKQATTEYGLSAVEQVMELVAHKGGNILITIDEVHDLMQQADNLYEVEAQLLNEAKKKNNYEEYDEFNAEDQLQQLINFTADKVVNRAEAPAESRAHAEAEAAKGTKRKRQTPRKKMFQPQDSLNRKKIMKR